MPNLAIVNYCNLKCPYCFADDMIKEETTAVTMDDFRKMLEFCSRTPMNHIGIIGGEPTLHPQFSEILKEVNKYCRECDTSATLFTNGIELEKYLPYIGDRIGILINCNTPANQSAESYKKHLDVLDHLYELSWFESKVSLGCNVFLGCVDYNYMWDLVDKYHLKHIRCSAVSPGGCYHEWRAEKEKYYLELKPIFVQFCRDAIKHNCKLNMDCGHIPMCYFTMEEKEVVEAACENLYQDFCEPVMDITPDFKVTSCFGAYDPIDIRDFDNIIEVQRYLLLVKNYKRALNNGGGRCSTCKKHKLLQCQGGCLGFAEV